MPKVRVKRPRGRKPLPVERKKVTLRYYVYPYQALEIEKFVKKYLAKCEE